MVNKYMSSYVLVKYDDCKIILIEIYPCNANNELLARERDWEENTKCFHDHIKNLVLITEKDI